MIDKIKHSLTLLEPARRINPGSEKAEELRLIQEKLARASAENQEQLAVLLSAYQELTGWERDWEFQRLESKAKGESDDKTEEKRDLFWFGKLGAEKGRQHLARELNAIGHIPPGHTPPDTRTPLTPEAIQARLRQWDQHIAGKEGQGEVAEYFSAIELQLAWSAGTTVEERKTRKEATDGAKEKLERAIEREQHWRHESIQFRPPELIYAAIERRTAESAEMKLLQTKSYEELIGFFEKALEEKDKIRAGAVLRHLADDFNDNEIWNAYGYPSNDFGMKAFYCEIMMGREAIWIKDATGRVLDVVPGEEGSYKNPLNFGMNMQEALRNCGDISFINESRNHWDTARIVTAEDGQLKFFSHREHVISCAAEVRKLGVREVLRNFNRLNYGGESPFGKGVNGGRKFVLSELGLAIIKEWGPKQARYIFEDMSVNTAKVVLYDNIDFLIKCGVHPDIIDAAKRRVEATDAPSGVGDAVDASIETMRSRGGGLRFEVA